jgi:hypothetical protein
MLRHATVLALVLLTGCKDSAKERAVHAVQASDFWPEAPKATKPAAPRTLRYKGESLNGYTITAKGGTTPDAAMKISFSMTMQTEFRAREGSAERDGFLKAFDMDMDAAGQGMTMRFDGDTMSVSAPGQGTTTLRRGEPGVIDVGEIADKPFYKLSVGDGTSVSMEGIPDHPLLKLAGGGDMMDNALLLFPDLPKEPISVGHRWTIKRDTAVGTTGAKVPVTYSFTYAGDASCPSGATTCSVLDLTAEANDVKVSQNGIDLNASFGFAGKVYLDYAKGAVDESRVRMQIDVEAQGMKVPMTATFGVKPT